VLCKAVVPKGTAAFFNLFLGIFILQNNLMPPPGKQLYFIALVPPSPLYDEAQQWKEYMSDHYQSRAALKSPPHITLHMPFEWKEKKEEQLIFSLQKFGKGRTPFTVVFNGFSCFEPRVIFIQVEQSHGLKDLHDQLFRYCKQKLNLFNANYHDQPFHPHLTIAFRDLKKQRFADAWNEFRNKSFHGSFAADKITLMKHDGQRWHPFREIHF
jgi:2'-5' RNA ligase